MRFFDDFRTRLIMEVFSLVEVKDYDGFWCANCNPAMESCSSSLEEIDLFRRLLVNCL